MLLPLCCGSVHIRDNKVQLGRVQEKEVAIFTGGSKVEGAVLAGGEDLANAYRIASGTAAPSESLPQLHRLIVYED
jgi:hypothetical protein